MSNTLIQMPEGIIQDESSYSDTFGRYIIQPLERGFGVTLGNALRRVLISSMPGVAFTAVKIDGVLHEFSTIPGIKEDVAEIILNLKSVRFKVLDKKLTKINLKFNGSQNVTAGDIQKQVPTIEILNPDQHIATLGKDAKLDMELRIGKGKGYVPAEENKNQEHTIGLISMDSVYSPILNVVYFVESTRVGSTTDLEKLTIEIETDGSITPEDALSQSAKILKDHFQMFINLDTEPEVESKAQEMDQELQRVKKILVMPVDELELSVRCHNCLKAANIVTLADLVKKEEHELLKFRNFGRKSLDELNEKIKEYGLSFGMNIDKYFVEENS